MKTQRFGIMAIHSSQPRPCSGTAARANGGAGDRNAAATDQKKTTNVTIEDEKLTIDLHQNSRR